MSRLPISFVYSIDCVIWQDLVEYKHAPNESVMVISVLIQYIHKSILDYFCIDSIRSVSRYASVNIVEK